MREIKMSDEIYNFASKVLEDNVVQMIARKLETDCEEELTQLYELFHKKRKVPK